MRTKAFLRKPCSRCDKMFQPTGKQTKLCDKCKETTYTSRRKYTQHVCAVCGVKVNNKLLVEARKGIYYPMCRPHFDEYRTDCMAIVREKIKKRLCLISPNNYPLIKQNFQSPPN